MGLAHSSRMGNSEAGAVPPGSSRTPRSRPRARPASASESDPRTRGAPAAAPQSVRTAALLRLLFVAEEPRDVGFIIAVIAVVAPLRLLGVGRPGKDDRRERDARAVDQRAQLSADPVDGLRCADSANAIAPQLQEHPRELVAEHGEDPAATARVVLDRLQGLLEEPHRRLRAPQRLQEAGGLPRDGHIIPVADRLESAGRAEQRAQRTEAPAQARQERAPVVLRHRREAGAQARAGGSPMWGVDGAVLRDRRPSAARGADHLPLAGGVDPPGPPGCSAGTRRPLGYFRYLSKSTMYQGTLRYREYPSSGFRSPLFRSSSSVPAAFTGPKPPPP